MFFWTAAGVAVLLMTIDIRRMERENRELEKGNRLLMERLEVELASTLTSVAQTQAMTRENRQNIARLSGLPFGGPFFE